MIPKCRLLHSLVFSFYSPSYMDLCMPNSDVDSCDMCPTVAITTPGDQCAQVQEGD